MKAHKIEVVLTEDGTLTLQGLPFHAGDAVEVIILETKTSQYQAQHIPQSTTNPYPMHNTKPYCYDDPTQPVALEDWEVLQ
ncbi:hypothetical protein G7B40_012985 [Aetokthonos hydrillicola Thurmond2011]|jgi:hypothetical protein|uniref:Uncharacterized protein n=1 Tax=Aetokthonos hydrillicola Thurmond2011 TaxID=2712845 RepID=A0AAP5M7V0_9CYAN|nr:hypothetical protein [Aetokthonos hydrillicola]MBO3459466.1 hypothetical protein [Aetokthonos hydrillicola CCALA 1050]MBW4583829.1 hypothetical protein [Aetokthonos hydrillicola CCALA 1050]MDR9895475.1 hypothetical protein [Aetokthonos hydrillicola Thurmond2011]